MASINQSNPAYPRVSSQQRKTVKWRIVTERHGKYYLYYFEVEENLPGSMVMHHIVELCSREAALHTFVFRWHWIRRPVIDTAVLEGIPDPEAQHLKALHLPATPLTMASQNAAGTRWDSCHRIHS
ncbi:hypothetical protein FHL15_011395 [Xylaria flabelliformis]|uniref:Uncharacterized protein n=1 Tax=Xylaria flabelliformis TaxID=2512241 RepID=A0A553HIF0_9PEZI|nr:hypothetical protein FHL15_011395 [Xylaria flabelliformis]